MLPLPRFLSFIQENTLFTSADKILLAVSGGKDSVLMAHLFNGAGIDFGIAHCNFGLRGAASDADELFTEELAKQFGVPFFSTRFNTEEFASANKISIQMAARDLRYAWFEEIRVIWGYHAIALAHHSNDVIETVLLNLVRGTGISGLHGILPKRDHVCRPLLFLTGGEIAALVSTLAIPYREDESNSSLKYARNNLRHQVVPVLKELNPNLERTFETNSRRFAEVEAFLNQHTTVLRQKLFTPDNRGFSISIPQLQQLDPLRLLLFELFRPFGFSEEVLADLVRSWDHIPGKVFRSATHVILVDRGILLLRPIQPEPTGISWEADRDTLTWNGITITRKTSDAADAPIIPGPNFAFVPADMLSYPMILRPWRQGDIFYPLGMTGKKKLSDLFVNLKIPLTAKHTIPLLVNGNGDIIWVAGYRMDNRYKVEQHTKKVTIFERINSHGK